MSIYCYFNGERKFEHIISLQLICIALRKNYQIMDVCKPVFPNLFGVMDPFDHLDESCGSLNEPVKTLLKNMWPNRAKTVFKLILKVLRNNV